MKTQLTEGTRLGALLEKCAGANAENTNPAELDAAYV